MEKKSKLIKEAEETRRGFIEMYKAGFADGYNSERKVKLQFDSFKEKALKSFEMRFFGSREVIE